MLHSSDAFQGVVLRSIIVQAARPVFIEGFNRYGRLDAFVIDSRIGVFIKYSSKRMTPWSFTFHIEQVSELLDLEIEHPLSFIVFVCGVDGLACVELATLHRLVSFKKTEQAWLRIERKPRTLYMLVGNRGELENKVPNGVAPVLAALTDGPQ